MITGSMAPVFTANGLIGGEQKSFSLGDFAGKWVVLFFYSGDFTFV